MKKINKLFLILPALLLASCNFKYTYVISGISADEEEGEEGEEGGIDDAGSYSIKVWVDQKIQSLTQAQIDTFLADNPKYKITYDVQPVSEGNATSNMLLDVQDGADLFVFAQDQLARLKVAGALGKITGSFADAIKEENSQDSVSAASLGDSIYAYPMTSDNGYFLMYDKRIYSESDVGNISTMLAKIKGTNNKLYFKAQSDGFYTASYFLARENGKPESAALCSNNWDLNLDTGLFTAFDDTFHEAPNGLIAAKGIKEIADKALVASDNSVSKFAPGTGSASGTTAAAVVTGIWDYEAAYKRMGIKDASGNIVDSYLGCAELPCYTVDGKDYHLGSYDGYKLMGIKPQRDAKKASVCRRLAAYLTGETCQTERFEQVSWGPTNKASSQDPGVVNHPGLAALNAQHKYATQQGQCPGEWFLALKTAASGVKTTSTDAELQTILDNYYAGLPVLLSDE